MVNSITVDSKLLTKACHTPATKARVKKSKHYIPEWTLFDGAMPGKLIITAPSHTTILDGEGVLMQRFSVNAKEMHDLMKRLEKLHEKCVLWIDDGTLFLAFGNTKISVKTVIK